MKKKPKKLSPHTKGFGFWKVKKTLQRGVKIYKILRVDDEKCEIERFGRVEFARRFVKAHNGEILDLIKRAQAEKEKQLVRIAPYLALLHSVPEICTPRKRR